MLRASSRGGLLSGAEILFIVIILCWQVVWKQLVRRYKIPPGRAQNKWLEGAEICLFAPFSPVAEIFCFLSEGRMMNRNDWSLVK